MILEVLIGFSTIISLTNTIVLCNNEHKRQNQEKEIELKNKDIKDNKDRLNKINEKFICI